MLTAIIRTTTLATVCTLLAIGSAYADITAMFEEGAPKDRFTFTNVGSCDIVDATLTLDLSGSKSGLIFDVSNQGAGVQVFQPFEMVSGQKAVKEKPSVVDGASKIELKLSKLEPNSSIAFTIDVDDTLGGREITVSNNEFSGVVVQLMQARKTYSALFLANSKAILALPGC